MNAFIINIIRELENSARKGEDKALIIALAEELITELKKLPENTPQPEQRNVAQRPAVSYNVPMPPSRIKVELKEEMEEEVPEPKEEEPVFETILQNDDSGNSVEILEEKLTREPPRYIESNFVSKIRPEEFKPEPIDPATVSEEFVLPVTEEMLEEAMKAPEEENETEVTQEEQPEEVQEVEVEKIPAQENEKDRAWKPQAEPAPKEEEIAEKAVAEATPKAAKTQARKTQPTQLEINDLFSKEAEASHTLNPLGGMRITDLRNAFNISEKYQLVEELFSRDETLFNRSIQTINQFDSLPQAIFWIEKELRVRQGWQEEHSLVQFFYDVVRRRFS